MSFEFKDFGFYLIDEPYLKYLHKKGLSDPPTAVCCYKLRMAAAHAVKQDALLFFSSNHRDVSAERGGLASSLHIKKLEYTTSWGIICQ